MGKDDKHRTPHWKDLRTNTLREVVRHCKSKDGLGCIGCPWISKGSAVVCFQAMIYEIDGLLNDLEEQ